MITNVMAAAVQALPTAGISISKYSLGVEKEAAVAQLLRTAKGNPYTEATLCSLSGFPGQTG